MRRGELREPVMTLVFTWLTCGFYLWYWMYVASEEINAGLGRREYDPGTELVLAIVTCGFWMIWWDWRMAESIVELEQRSGLVPKMEPGLMFLTKFLGLGPLFYQRSMNHAWQFGKPVAPPNRRLEKGHPGGHQQPYHDPRQQPSPHHQQTPHGRRSPHGQPPHRQQPPRGQPPHRQQPPHQQQPPRQPSSDPESPPPGADGDWKSSEPWE